MKGLCSGSVDNDYIFQFDNESPEVGRYYTLEDAARGTGAQNRAFHSLLMEYYKSGAHSYDDVSFKDFKNLIKKDLGAGFDKFFYADIVDGKPVAGKAEKYDDIPEHIRNDPDRKDMIFGSLKSWSDYTKKERKNLIDNLIAEMHQVGVNTTKFHEILRGMDG